MRAHVMVEFMGGPLDGEVRAVPDLQPFEVVMKSGDRIYSGWYTHGKLGQRGKMVWQGER